MIRIIFTALSVSILGLVIGQQTNTQPCWNHFVTQFYQCATNNTINSANLVHFTRNGSDGTAPANMELFKTQACSKEDLIFNCTIRIRDALLNHTGCSDSEKSTIFTFFMNTFRTYDTKCAHPCRYTLKQSMRACYVESKLDPEMFLPNATTARGNMLGETMNDVNSFCNVRDPLVKCMKSEQMNCPESAFVLNSIGLDMFSMETSVGVLCSHPKVYLDSQKCFSRPSSEVQNCLATQNRDVMKLGLEAQQNKMNQQTFLKHFCNLRLKNLRCDLSAWRNNTLKEESCNDAIVGMKTELDCKLVPPECRQMLGANYTLECDAVKFNTGHRDNYGNGGFAVVSSGLAAILVFVCYLLQNLS